MESDLVFAGVDTDADLAKLDAARAAMRDTGALWVIHPKGKGGVKDTAVFARARALELVATKVMKFSGTHTAEKLMVPARGRRRG